MEVREENTFLTKVKEKTITIKDWCRDHPTEMAALLPVFISAGVDLIKIVADKSSLKEERRIKEKYIYDRSLGYSYELKRKLSSSECIEISSRKKTGESLGIILKDMKLVK